jgi:hypothetical protein
MGNSYTKSTRDARCKASREQEENIKRREKIEQKAAAMRKSAVLIQKHVRREAARRKVAQLRLSKRARDELSRNRFFAVGALVLFIVATMGATGSVPVSAVNAIGMDHDGDSDLKYAPALYGINTDLDGDIITLPKFNLDGDVYGDMSDELRIVVGTPLELSPNESNLQAFFYLPFRLIVIALLGTFSALYKIVTWGLGLTGFVAVYSISTGRICVLLSRLEKDIADYLNACNFMSKASSRASNPVEAVIIALFCPFLMMIFFILALVTLPFVIYLSFIGRVLELVVESMLIFVPLVVVMYCVLNSENQVYLDMSLRYLQYIGGLVWCGLPALLLLSASAGRR